MDPEKKRLRKLQELGLDRPILAGSLNRVERTSPAGNTTVYWLLTYKEDGKTRSVYVPKDLVKEVQSWIRNHRRLKEKLAALSAMSIAVIRSHASRGRATARGGDAKSRARRNSQ